MNSYDYGHRSAYIHPHPIFMGIGYLGAPDHSDRPSFTFHHTQTIIFNADQDDMMTIIAKISNSKGVKFTFDVIDGENYATGKGASKHVYNKLFNEMASSIMKKIHMHFVDVNPEHSFWQSKENIECFVMLIGMMISNGIVMPFHFAPVLWESICVRTLHESELEFFY